jgi:hypothetical protein
MAQSELDLSLLTMNPQEADNVSMAIFEQAYDNDSLLGRTHGLITGIQMKTQIPFLGLLGDVGKKSVGCTPSTSTETVPTTEKFADPELIDYRLIHCQNLIPQLFKMWKKAAKAANTWEEASEVVDFISDKGIEATLQAILRLGLFGDKLAENVTDGGSITDGVDVTLLTPINGIFQQIFADATLVRYTIDENVAATKVAQLALAPDAALQAMRYMYNNIDPRVFDVPGLKFQMTRSLWNNWKDFLEDKSLIFQLDQTENSSSKGTYRGFDIEVRNDWDRNILKYNDQGTTLLYPHRAIFTPIGNIPIITTDEESMKKVDSFYDKVTKSWYLDAAWYLDAKLLQESMIAVAY